MTDEQLQRAVREIHLREMYIAEAAGFECYWVGEEMVGIVKEMDAAAVAILREEIAKAQAANYAMAERLFPFIPHTDDDPTKSFVATT